jgi:hypothetical protein
MLRRGLKKYHPPAGDTLQRPLRSRFQARLTRSVDTTSDVKGWEQLFYVCIFIFSFVSQKSWSQSDTTVEHAAIRWLSPTCLASVRGLPHSRPAYALRGS